jgi:hypothetical protein
MKTPFALLLLITSPRTQPYDGKPVAAIEHALSE